MASLDSRGMIGRIYVGGTKHCYILNIYTVGLVVSEKRIFKSFPHYKFMGDVCCYGNKSSNPICPKTLCRLFPDLLILHMKFDQDWPSGIRDILI